jgi:hypothetical protein
MRLTTLTVRPLPRLHGTLVFMLECQLMPEGVKAKKPQDVAKTLKGLVTEQKQGKNAIAEKMLQVYVLTASRLFDHLSGPKHDRMVAPVTSVRDAATVADAIEAMRKHVDAEVAKTGAKLSLNGLRRWLGFSTGHNRPATPVNERVGTAVANAVKAVSAEDSKVKPQAVAQAIGGAVSIAIAPDVCRLAIDKLVQAGNIAALQALAAQIDSALDAAARKNELPAKAQAAIAARKAKRHATAVTVN